MQPVCKKCYMLVWERHTISLHPKNKTNILFELFRTDLICRLSLQAFLDIVTILSVNINQMVLGKFKLRWKLEDQIYSDLEYALFYSAVSSNKSLNSEREIIINMG